jgi:hypothetical protein
MQLPDRSVPADSGATLSETPAPVDAHPWRAAVWITLAAVVLEMVCTLWLVPLALYRVGWFVAADAWAPIPAAHYVAYGAIPYLYEGSPYFVAGPTLPLLLAPVAAIGSLFDLTQSIPAALNHPTLWLVYGPYGIGLSMLFLAAIRRLAVQAGVRTGLVPLQLASVLVVLLPSAGMWMHFEEPLAMACAMWAVTEVLRGNDRRAAIAIGIAICTKQWALLGLPLIVAAAPPGRRVRALAWGAGIPAALFAVPLAFDWSYAAPQLFAAHAYPHAGHAALWVPSAQHITVGTPFRALAVACAIVIARRLRGRTEPTALIAALASVLVMRLVFEPVLFAYYLAPPLAVLLVYELVRTGRVVKTVVFGLAALLLFALHPHPVVWWAAEVALIAPIAGPALSEAFALPPIRRRELVPAG